jgi:hypothetical protein
MALTAKLNRDDLKMNGTVSHERGRLRLDVEVSNLSSIPMEKVRLEPRYNSADLTSHEKSKDNLAYLLPGDKWSTTFWLEPRVSIEKTLIGLRLRAKGLREELEFGLLSINKKGRPYSGAGNIPRM